MLLHEDSPSSKDCKGILLAREQVHFEAFKSAPTASKSEGLRVFPQTPAGNWSCQCYHCKCWRNKHSPSCREQLTVSLDVELWRADKNPGNREIQRGNSGHKGLVEVLLMFTKFSV